MSSKIRTLLALIAVVAGPGQARTADAPLVLSEQLRLFESLQEVIVQVSSRVKPWVVHIEAVQKRGDQKYKVLGSGLILDSSGHILTNHHIVDEARLIIVVLPDSTKLEAVLVGSDRQTDLALIKIEPRKPLPVPVLGDSNAASVGEWIIAVGNPYGFDRTVYFGIVSGKGRTLSSLNSYQDADSGYEFTTDFIQTDASIDPGSSGGPLVNLRGEVIGINSMGMGRGMSFTIPINTAKDVAGKLLAGGDLARGWIGLAIQPLTDELAAYYGVKNGGVLVSDVAKNSPADRAGFRQGDIVQELDGAGVAASNEEELNKFSSIIWGSTAGNRIKARVRRERKAVALTVTVEEQPKTEAREVETGWGFNVKEITRNIFRDYLLDSRDGVLVSFVEAGTAGGEARLHEGDVIQTVEGASVATLADFEKQYSQLKDKTREVLLLVKRRKDYVFILLELAKYKPKSSPRG
jgi:serine protease Do